MVKNGAANCWYISLQNSNTNNTPPASSSIPSAWWDGTLGANWVKATGLKSFAAYTSYLTTTGSNPAKFANYYNNTFADNQYSQVGQLYGGGVGIAVRMQTDGSCYFAEASPFDNSGYTGMNYAIKYYNGTSVSTLNSAQVYDDPSAATSVRLEVNGTGTNNLTLKVDGVTRLQATHATLTSGKAGLFIEDAGPPNSVIVTNWAGGDL